MNKILLKAAANFKSTLSNKPKGFYRDEDDEQSSHSSDSAYINKDQVNKLNKELITTSSTTSVSYLHKDSYLAIVTSRCSDVFEKIIGSSSHREGHKIST